jgi:hypothetical protein
MPLKKQVHPGWEYSGLENPTQEYCNFYKRCSTILAVGLQSSRCTPTISQWKGTWYGNIPLVLKFFLEYSFCAFAIVQTLDSFAYPWLQR